MIHASFLLQIICNCRKIPWISPLLSPFAAESCVAPCAVSPSLPEVNRSIAVRPGSTWRRAAAFMGPGYLVAVGYMDPGNWATSIAGGSKYGYALLSVALISNIMAIILQSLCARLAVATGRDLAQACRDAYPKPVAWGLWLLGGACHLRHRSRGGHRHGHRPQPSLRHSARNRRRSSRRSTSS